MSYDQFWPAASVGVAVLAVIASSFLLGGKRVTWRANAMRRRFSRPSNG